ncbi:helix-turn-helix domain-containing protein [bacterium]|nr:helix-turn-helix domain-containing protein [bacterium]
MDEQKSGEERQDFGKRLKHYRRAFGFTQEDVAFAIEAGTTTYSEWERGHALPRADDVIKLCDVFKCSADELLGRVVHVSSYKQFDMQEGTQWVALDVSKIAPYMEHTMLQGLRAFEALVIRRNTQKDVLETQEFYGYTSEQLFGIYRILIQFGVLRLTHVPRNEEYERRVAQRYPHLKHVIVAKTHPIDAPIIQAEHVAFLAARHTITASRNIGIGAGYTMLRMAELSLAEPQQFRGTRWIPLISFRDDSVLKYSANYIVARFRQLHSGSEVSYLPYEDAPNGALHPLHQSLLSHASVYLSVSGRDREAFTGDVDDVSQFQAADDTIAVPSISQQYQALVALDKREEVCGEILGRIVDKQGNEFPQVQQGVSGLQLKHLKQLAATQLVWCVAASSYKAQMVKTAVEERMVNGLVIDTDIAKVLTG